LPKWFSWAKDRREPIFGGSFGEVSAVCAYIEAHAGTIDPFIQYLRGGIGLQRFLDWVKQYES
jgi:hypothetical protein